MYAITGATGHTGSRVAQHLLHHGHQVRAIGRNADHLRSLVVLGAEPFIADLNDVTALSKAFAGAEGVYAMIPPNLTSRDYRAEQERISDCIAAALAETRVPYVVSLSSIGADKSSGTGPVVGLHNLEQKLNSIPGLNTLHVRAGYFMENTLPQAAIIAMTGNCAGPLRPDLKLPMVCTRDIGFFAAQELVNLVFQGHQTREVQGFRDYTYKEVAQIIGREIGRPNLQYIQLPDDKLRPAMGQMGMSSNMVDLILEMSAALNSGQMVALEPRTAHNTTTTSFETFVIGEFSPAYYEANLEAA
jgi:uncharacterized protein YbjT (DUF2867 family)